MSKKRYLHSVLIMAVFAMIFSISAVCAMAESSVDITQPADGSQVKPGYVDVWTRFAQPPNMGDIAITEGQASYINSHYGVSYSPVHYKVYKDGNLCEEKDVDQAKLNFTTSGSKSTTFLFEDEGTYEIQASVPRTADEYSSVTINVAGEYDGVDYSNSGFDSTDSDTITEGIPVRTTLTPDNSFSTTYKLTPAKSGWYVFFSSGYTKRIRGTLYEGVGGKSSVKRVASDNGDSGQFGFSAELTAGTTYTLLIEGYVKKTDTVFDVGFFSKESGGMMASASEITLTDPNRTYRFGVCQGTEIPKSAHWVIADDSVVGSDSSSSFSRGTPEYDTYYNGATITLNARKNGSTTVSFVDGDVTYAICNIVCKDIPEDSGSDDQGGDDEQKPDGQTDDEPEWSSSNPGYYIYPEKEEYSANVGETVTIKFSMSCDAKALGSGSRFLYYADHVPKSSQSIIKYKALSEYEFTESNGKLVADGYIDYDCLTAGTGQLYIYMLVNGKRYDKHVITINVTDPSSDEQQSGGEQTPVVGPVEEKGEDGTPYGKGASAEAAEAAITDLPNDNDPKGASFAPLMLRSTKQTNTSIKLTWKKVSGAKTYVIYGNKCGKTNKPKRLGKSKGSTKTIKTVAGKRLKKGTYYKFIVVALDSSGHVVSTSKIVHAVTKGGKNGNPTKVTVSKKVKKNKLTLKKGKTFKLAGKAAGKKVKKHVAVRYESSNPKIATVNKNGQIKGLKKGKCKIYVFAHNGVCTTIKLTIK